MTARVLPSELRSVPLASLHEHPDNPRRGNLEVLSESIDVNGFYGALIVQRSTMRVIAGNHRLQAMRALGAAEVPVLLVDVDDTHAARILLADNRTNDRATYDEAALYDLLSRFDDEEALRGTGYTVNDVALLQPGWSDDVGDDWDKAEPAAPDDITARIVCKVPRRHEAAARDALRDALRAFDGELA